jgi:hypothetical protein
MLDKHCVRASGIFFGSYPSRFSGLAIYYFQREYVVTTGLFSLGSSYSQHPGHPAVVAVSDHGT